MEKLVSFFFGGLSSFRSIYSVNAHLDDRRTDEALRAARRFGVALGELIDASIDPHQVRPLMMEAMTARTADSGSDFSPGEISIRRSVRSTFALAEPMAP